MKLPRNAQLWLPDYVRSRFRANGAAPSGARVWLTICDHYEPEWLKPDAATSRSRVATWERQWPQIARRHADSAGRHPVYTFFFPQEEYRREYLDPLTQMTADRIADVDIHIHHHGEGEKDFVDRMYGFIETLTQGHGLLRRHEGRPVFGFIHGNWALDNSRPDGLCCGLNNEITLLREMGCYADFTMPSGASPTQSRTVNQIYWVNDDPAAPRSFDHGVQVRPGEPGEGDLLMITGPMGLRWRERLMPRLETGEIAWQDAPTPYRIERWFDLAPRIGQDIFIKLYTHGAQERNSTALLDRGGLDNLFKFMGEACARRGYRWYSVSAWQMRQAVDCAARRQDPSQHLFGKEA
ncbi:MAG: hypothetical protein OEW16_06205 [Gammaproteobacteria bacterium]|nr:hypothetical protein [Betaproteobacteria bacterium]MDH4259883.1 hypothetical protein [Gammaproteobacteria bacterium]